MQGTLASELIGNEMCIVTEKKLLARPTVALAVFLVFVLYHGTLKLNIITGFCKVQYVYNFPCSFGTRKLQRIRKKLLNYSKFQ